MVRPSFTSWVAVVVCLSLATFGIKGCIFIVAGVVSMATGFLLMTYYIGKQQLPAVKAQMFNLRDFYPGSTGIPSLLTPHVRSVRSWNREDLTGSSLLDELIEEILNYIFRDFVQCWYGQLTNDQDFIENLRYSCYYAVNALSRRLRRVDWDPLLTRGLVDDFASHIRLYRKSVEKLQLQMKAGKGNKEDLESFFFDFELEMEKKYCRDLVASSRPYETAYLRDLCDILLYLLLPPDEFESRPFRLILREIVMNRVLLPFVDQLSSPDYINQTFVWLLSEFPIEIEHFMTVLEQSDHAEELSAVRDAIEHEINVQRSKDTGDDSVKQQLGSLFYVKRVVDAKLGRVIDPFGISNARPNSQPQTLPDLSLGFILSNHVGLSYFIDFLSTTDACNLIYLFVDIESFKVSAQQHLSSVHLMQVTKTGNSAKAQHYLETVREAASALYDQYLSEKSSSRVVMESSLVSKLLNEIQSKEPRETYFDQVQTKVFETLKSNYYVAFKDSPVYLKLLADLDMLKTRDHHSATTQSDEDSISVASAGSGTLDAVLDDMASSTSDFDAPRLTGEIVKIGMSRDGNKAFAVYQIQVCQESSSGESLASWFVSRRYSDFHDLHNLIEVQFPNIASFLEFPGKKTFNNLTQDFLEKRKRALSQYLNTLLCTDLLKHNRGLDLVVTQFLSKGPYNKGAGMVSAKKMDFLLNNPIFSGVRSVGSAVISVPDRLFDGVVTVSDELSKIFGIGVPNGVNSIAATNGSAQPLPLPPVFVTLESPEGRVAACLEGDNTSENIPLRILLLLMDEVFNLKQRNQWFRRRLVAFLQQIIRATLGNRINQKIVEFVQWLTSEEQVAEYIRAFRNSFWPNGVLADSYPERSQAVQMRTRVVAKAKLIGVCPDELELFIGNETTRRGALMVFEAFQNASLNRRFVYVILEHLIKTVFAQNHFEDIFVKLHSKSPRCQAGKL